MSERQRQLKAVLRLPQLQSMPLPDGGIVGGAFWRAVADRLDEISAHLPKRMAGHSLFDKALADFVAREIAGVAAEIRVNLALEEQDACMRRCRRG